MLWFQKQIKVQFDKTKLRRKDFEISLIKLYLYRNNFFCQIHSWIVRTTNANFIFKVRKMSNQRKQLEKIWAKLNWTNSFKNSILSLICIFVCFWFEFLRLFWQKVNVSQFFISWPSFVNLFQPSSCGLKSVF